MDKKMVLRKLVLALFVFSLCFTATARADVEDVVNSYSSVLYIGGKIIGNLAIDYRFKVILTYTGRKFYKDLGSDKKLLPNYLKEGEEYIFNGKARGHLFCAMVVVNRTGPFDPRLIKFVQGHKEYRLQLKDIVGKKEYFGPSTFLSGDEVYGYFVVPYKKLLLTEPFYIFYRKYSVLMDISRRFK